MNFNEAFNITVGHEGGYTANPKDRGNWTTGIIGKGKLNGTKYGVSAMAYPNVDIKNLSVEQAKVIYKRDYWDKAKCDQLPNGIRFHVFDCAVNSGVSRAIKTLQQALGVTADGIIGPKTINASLKANQSELLKKFYDIRIAFYKQQPSFKTFGKGWLNRVNANLIIGTR